MARTWSVTHEYYNVLARDIDEETLVWSGGMDRARYYRTIKAFGERVLPYILQDLEAPQERMNPWWRLQVVQEVAAKQNEPIEFADEIRYSLPGVVDRLVAWGHEKGYLPLESAPEPFDSSVNLANPDA